MVHGVPLINHPSQFCEECTLAKQTRLPFPNQAQFRASQPLELLYVDLCGPITPDSNAGNKYFFLLIDDFSRVMWVSMLKRKSEAKDMLRKFIVQVENETNHKIKALRSDRGGEFLAQEFESICEEKGIKRFFIAPYSPQQNGVVEHRNRTVMNMPRSLLKSRLLLGRFWAEAVRHAAYILNRVPTKSLEGQTPYEALRGRKPNLEHLRVFGCLGYAKIPTHLRKLDDISKELIYLGVEPGSKASRMYSLDEDKIIVSCDVIYCEDKTWN